MLGALINAMAGESDRQITGSLETCVLQAVKASGQSMRQATLRAGAAESPGIGTDRNDPGRPGDPLLSVLQFENDNGEQVIIYSTACHPTVLNADNTLVSADFPGAAAAALEQGKVKMAMFLNGSAGDVSTRFTRRGPGFDEVERLGAMLAAQVKEVLGKLPAALSDFTLAGGEMRMQMDLRKANSPQQEKENLERLKNALAEAKGQGADKAMLRLLEARCEGAFLGLLYSQNQPEAESVSLRIQFLQLGPLCLVFFPVELFSVLSNPLRADIPGLVPVSYANGYFGYLPDRGIEQTDNYEKFTTVFAYGQGEKLIAEIARQIPGNTGKREVVK